MSRINQRLMQFGTWDLTLRKGIPESLLRKLIDNPWGEVYFTAKRFPKPFHTKAGLKAVSQFTGILWSITRDPVAGTVTITGPSNTAWLGDPDKNRGDLRKVMVTFIAEPVVSAVTSLLPPSVTAGSIQAPVPGQTMNTKHYLEPTKASVQMIADLTGGEWRVNPNGTFDFGNQTQLGYVTTPNTVVFPRSVGNALVGLPPLAPSRIRPIKAAKVEVLLDVQDYITEALELGPGGGQTIWWGAATPAVGVPYKDPNGNTLVWRETFNDPMLSITDGPAKAQQVVDDKSVLRQAVTLDLSDYVMGGSYTHGDYIYIYDPPMLQDLSVALPFGSGYIHPAAIRLLSVDGGVKRGMGVYFRDHNDVIYDLSDLFEPDESAPRFEVGEFKRSAINTSLATSIALGRITDADEDATVPAQVASFAEHAEGVTYTELGGYRAWQEFKWDPVTTNVGGDSMTDGSHYIIAYGVKTLIDAGGLFTYSAHIPLTDISGSPVKVHATIRDLLPSVEYYFKCRCRDLHDNPGAWSATLTIVTPTDTTAPATPPTPVITAIQSGNIKITVDLSTGGWGAANPDVSFFRFFYGTATAPVTEVAQFPVTYAQLIGGETISWLYQVPEDDIGGTVYGRLKAVDMAGNESVAYSTEDDVVAVLPNDYYGLPNARDNLVPDPSFETGPGNHPVRFTGAGAASTAVTADVTTTYPRTGLYGIKHDPALGKGLVNIWPHGQQSKPRGWPQVLPDQQVYFGFFCRKVGVGAVDRVRAGIRWLDYTGAVISTTYSAYYTPTTSHVLTYHTATAPAGTVAVQYFVSKAADAADEVIWFDDFYGRILVTERIVGDKEITAPKIGGSGAGNVIAEDVDIIMGATVGDASIKKSSDYDGSLDANGRLILTGVGAPTAGWAIDGAGNAAFANVLVRGTVYATDGELGDLSVTGTLTLSGSGKLETTSGYSAGGLVPAVVLSAADKDRITLYSGIAAETVAAFIQAAGSVDHPNLFIAGPDTAVAGGPAFITFDDDRLTLGFASHQVDVFDGSMLPRLDNDIDLGSATLSFKNIYAYNLYDENGVLVLDLSAGLPAGAPHALDAGQTDVTITLPADNDLLAYDTGTATWINQNAAAAGLSASGHTHTYLPLAGGTMVGALLFASGSAAAPGLAAAANTDTGIYYAATLIGVSIDGVGQVTFTDGAIVPVTDNDIDLGTAALSFKNIYADKLLDQAGTVRLNLSGDWAPAGAITPTADNTSDLGTALLSFRNAYLFNLYDEAGVLRFDLSGNLTPAGHVIPGSDVALDLGTALLSWRSYYGQDIYDEAGVLRLDLSGTWSPALHVIPTADNTSDLGTALLSFKDAYLHSLYDEAGVVRWDLSAAITAASGTAANPTYAFSADIDCGFYYLATPAIVVSIAGAAQVAFIDGSISPAFDNDIDLGSASVSFKGIYGYALYDEAGTLRLDLSADWTIAGHLLPGADNASNLGSATVSFLGLYAFDIYDEAGTKRLDLGGDWTPAGSIIPGADNTSDLGTAVLSFRNGYLYALYDEAGAQFADLSAQTEAAHSQSWTAVTTNPANFTVTAGFQSRTGRRVTAHAIITCDAGFTVGSGIYIFGCPVAPSASYMASGGAGNGDTLGTIRLWDSSVGTYYTGHLTYRSSAGAGTCHAVFDGQTARWGHAGNPVAPAASDVLVLAWDYLAAAA